MHHVNLFLQLRSGPHPSWANDFLDLLVIFRTGIPDAALTLGLITAKSSELDVKKLGFSF